LFSPICEKRVFDISSAQFGRVVSVEEETEGWGFGLRDSSLRIASRLCSSIAFA